MTESLLERSARHIDGATYEVYLDASRSSEGASQPAPPPD